MGKPRIKKKSGSSTINIKNIKKMFEMIPISDEDGKEWLAVRITKGKFKGVIYKYGKIEVGEENEIETGKTPVNFEYTVLKSELSESVQGDKMFEKKLSDILMALMDEVISYKKQLQQIEEDEKSRSKIIKLT